MILFAAVALSFSSCGSYTIVSGTADEAAVCFTANKKFDITVTIDGAVYDVKTIKDKQYRSNRNIKQVVKQQITLTPGRHNVIVTKDGVEIYNHEIFISASDVKVIEL